jgi:octaprenyl-diphosphate synthase
MNDYVEGKCTLPYIYLYEALNTDDRERLVASHTKKISKDETLWIQEKMQEHTSIEKSFQIAQILSNEAQNAMSEDKELVSILESMIKRTF